MKKTILILDTELNDYISLKQRLEQINFLVHTSENNLEGFNKVFKLKPDLIIYNYQLFLLAEKELNEKFIRYNMFIPIIMVNYSSLEDDVLLAFDRGAADYITKPFSSREVEARVKAILRRIEISKTPTVVEIKIGNLVLKPELYEIQLITHNVSLSKREQQLLLLLIDRKKISKEEILRYLLGADYYGESRIVDVIICNLRRKIEVNPKRPQYIKTIKGYGYYIDDPNSKEV